MKFKIKLLQALEYKKQQQYQLTQEKLEELYQIVDEEQKTEQKVLCCVELSSIYILRSNFQRALDIAKEAYDIDPYNNQVKNQYADALYFNGEYEESLVLFYDTHNEEGISKSEDAIRKEINQGLPLENYLQNTTLQKCKSWEEYGRQYMIDDLLNNDLSQLSSIMTAQSKRSANTIKIQQRCFCGCQGCDPQSCLCLDHQNVEIQSKLCLCKCPACIKHNLYKLNQLYTPQTDTYINIYDYQLNNQTANQSKNQSQRISVRQSRAGTQRVNLQDQIIQDKQNVQNQNTQFLDKLNEQTKDLDNIQELVRQANQTLSQTQKFADMNKGFTYQQTQKQKIMEQSMKQSQYQSRSQTTNNMSQIQKLLQDIKQQNVEDQLKTLEQIYIIIEEQQIQDSQLLCQVNFIQAQILYNQKQFYKSSQFLISSLFYLQNIQLKNPKKASIRQEQKKYEQQKKQRRELGKNIVENIVRCYDQLQNINKAGNFIQMIFNVESDQEKQNIDSEYLFVDDKIVPQFQLQDISPDILYIYGKYLKQLNMFDYADKVVQQAHKIITGKRYDSNSKQQYKCQTKYKDQFYQQLLTNIYEFLNNNQ